MSGIAIRDRRTMPVEVTPGPKGDIKCVWREEPNVLRANDGRRVRIENAVNWTNITVTRSDAVTDRISLDRKEVIELVAPDYFSLKKELQKAKDEIVRLNRHIASIRPK